MYSRIGCRTCGRKSVKPPPAARRLSHGPSHGGVVSWRRRRRKVNFNTASRTSVSVSLKHRYSFGSCGGPANSEALVKPSSSKSSTNPKLEDEARELEAPHQAVAVRVHHIFIAARDLRGHRVSTHSGRVGPRRSSAAALGRHHAIFMVSARRRGGLARRRRAVMMSSPSALFWA